MAQALAANRSDIEATEVGMKEKPQYHIGQSTELRTASCTMQRLQRPSLALMEFDAFLQYGQLIYIL